MRDTATKLAILMDHLRDTFASWRREIWQRDLDQQYCCNGRECGCMGATVRDVYCMRAVHSAGEKHGK